MKPFNSFYLRQESCQNRDHRQLSVCAFFEEFRLGNSGVRILKVKYVSSLVFKC